MPENEKVMTNRDRYSERLKKKYPDKEYADDEALFAQINDDYDDYDNQIERYKNDERTFSDMFTKNPQSARFLSEWQKGGDPVVAMIREYGDDFKSALEDPEKAAEIAAANKEYTDRAVKNKEYEQQYEQNSKETAQMLDRVQKEDGLPDEQIDKAMEFLTGIMRDGLLGKFSEESVRMALKAMDYDTDVAAAGYEGEVRGRNAKIDTKLRNARKNDGTADLAGMNAGAGSKRQMQSIFSEAAGAR